MKEPHRQTAFIESHQRQAGSAMIISLIFTCIITFGIAGLLPLALNSWKMSARSSGQDAAFGLAESAADEAIWAILEFGTDESDWEAAGWTESDNGAYWHREWNLSDYSKQLGDNYQLDENRVGKCRVVVQKADSSIINITCQGIVEGGSNVTANYKATRYIETQFRRPNPFQYGLIAKNQLTFNGQPSFSSFHSGKDAWRNNITWKSIASNPFRKNVTVGSASTDASKVSAGGAKIFGDIATGASDDGSGSVQGRASVSGDVLYEFEMELPSVVAPDTSGIGWNTTL